MAGWLVGCKRMVQNAARGLTTITLALFPILSILSRSICDAVCQYYWVLLSLTVVTSVVGSETLH